MSSVTEEADDGGLDTVGAQHWEGADGAELAERWGVPRVSAHRSVGSTNDLAARLAADGAPAGTVVVAGEQTAGRGRAGRSWSSPAGLGLFLSMVCRPESAEAAAPIPLVAGVEAARALETVVADVRVELKWPNDLHCAGRKLGGILCEGFWQSASQGFAILGIGINVAQDVDHFPPELRTLSTSLAMEAGQPMTLAAVADKLVPALFAAVAARAAWTADRAAEYAARDSLAGREVELFDPWSGNPLARGRALGLGPQGAFRIRTADGGVREFVAGTVRPISTSSKPT